MIELISQTSNEWWSNASGTMLGAVGVGGLGALAGVFGAATGYFAPRGMYKSAVLTIHGGLIVIGLVSLIAGIVAVSTGQPYHVFYPLLLGGGILSVVMGAMFPSIRAKYRQAEMRKMDAEELRRG